MKKYHLIRSYLKEEPEDHYHGAAKDNMSSHQLTLFRRMPYAFWRQMMGLAVKKDSPSLFLGSAAHKYILEGEDALKDIYTWDSPVNPKTKEPYGTATKKYKEWKEAQDKTVITRDTFIKLVNMLMGIGTNSHAVEYLSEGVAEGVIRVKYNGVPCQIRIDFLSACEALVDLKTCADIAWFWKDYERYDYGYQFAFYQKVVEIATGVKLPFICIAVQSSEPFVAGVWAIDQGDLDIYADKNEKALNDYKVSLRTNFWPTRYENLMLMKDNRLNRS